MKIFLYSGTHWDREWYRPFQGFRYLLVRRTDELLDGLETADDYGVFHFDGQTIVLEDYLEIQPQNRERLVKLIKSGKIIVGPWYCMPDEFLCSGESLIKNLQRGHMLARTFGAEPSKNGYICDIFGHIAQMPQIFDGMDIHHTVLGRGTNEHTTPMHFRWTSPDGTDVRAFKLADVPGYGDFTQYVLQTTASHVDIPQDELERRIKEYIDTQIERANVPVLFLLDALDHNSFHIETGRYIKAIKKLYPDAEVYHTPIDDMGEAVDKYLCELPRKYGELNETAKLKAGYLHLITNTLSSRYNLKKYNDTLQTTLEKWIAPIYALKLTDASAGYLSLANKYLIQNHPHDSICGCSIDQVHRDMLYRFDQARLITEELLGTFREQLAGDISRFALTSGSGTGYKLARIFNPLPYSYTGSVEFEVNFEKNYPTKYAEPFGYENICSFRLHDANGTEIPYGIADIVTYPDRDVYKLNAQLTLAASSVTELEVRPSDYPSRYLTRLTQTATSAENEFIHLAVNADGTVTLTDKSTGSVYPSLMQLIDDGEIGDGWYHANPAVDRVVTSTSASVEISENNINRVVFKVTRIMRLPAHIDREHFGTRRSDEYADFNVVSYLTISRGEKFVAVRTIIDNNVLDHRLRLRLGTGTVGKTYFANQPFCFVEREVGIKAGTDDWKEYGVIEKQTGGIVIKRGAENGFAFISRYGIHECGVHEYGDIDITLFRSFNRTVGTNGEPDGELLQKLEFEYLLVPLDSSDTFASLQRRQDIFQAGVVSVTAYGSARKYKSALELTGESMVYSTSNPLDGGEYEIRVYNDGDTSTVATLALPENIAKASLTYIDGRHIAELDIKEGKVSFELGKWKIATIRCK
jgi:Alpha-mannosidase